MQTNRVKGGIIGFIIGDTLGSPVAALPKRDVLKYVGSITGYFKNYYHPFYYFLNKGQYGSNSRLTIASVESLSQYKKYNKKDLIKRLTAIAQRNRIDFFYSRWPGQTISKALITGKPVNSRSCTCIYSCIPIALMYDNQDEMLQIVESHARITHSSSVSQAANYFTCNLIFSLKNGVKPTTVFLTNLLNEMNRKYSDITELLDPLSKVIDGKFKTITQARKIIGTGSTAAQTLPISLYIFLKNIDNFRKAIIVGASSFRVDSPEDEEKLKYLPYMEQLLECRAGATDGIASLVGCFLGAYKGYNIIPKEFLTDLEDKERILDLIEKYYS